jgi:SAM-dependent methyltransferase
MPKKYGWGRWGKTMTCGRYEQEQAFTDAAAEKALAQLPKNLQVRSLNTFERLCADIRYLQHVPSFLGDLSGKRVLELGCGNGWISLRFAKSGADVWACDISPKMIELARRYARAADLPITFEQMICEKITYEDEFFDVVFMHMALHHCDIRTTLGQIKRVLKPGGKAVLAEDYAYHPLMRAYRTLTPSKHTDEEHPLTNTDLDLIRSSFSCLLEYYGLFDILKNTQIRWMSLKSFLRSVDDCLYKYFPSLKKYSRLLTIFLIK